MNDIGKLLGLATLLVGCGGSSPLACSVMTPSAAQCTQYQTSDSAFVSSTCATESGTFLPTACEDKGSLGVCSDLEARESSVADAGTVSYKVWVYPSTSVPDAGTAEAYCMGVLKGTWTVTRS